MVLNQPRNLMAYQVNRVMDDIYWYEVNQAIQWYQHVHINTSDGVMIYLDPSGIFYPPTKSIVNTICIHAFKEGPDISAEIIDIP